MHAASIIISEDFEVCLQYDAIAPSPSFALIGLSARASHNYALINTCSPPWLIQGHLHRCMEQRRPPLQRLLPRLQRLKLHQPHQNFPRPQSP